jgi:hypothetical protein
MTKDTRKFKIAAVVLGIIVLMLIVICVVLYLKLKDSNSRLYSVNESKNFVLKRMAKYGDKFDTLNSKYIGLKNGHGRDEEKIHKESFVYLKESECMKLCNTYCDK